MEIKSQCIREGKNDFKAKTKNKKNRPLRFFVLEIIKYIYIYRKRSVQRPLPEKNDKTDNFNNPQSNEEWNACTDDCQIKMHDVHSTVNANGCDRTRVRAQAHGS